MDLHTQYQQVQSELASRDTEQQTFLAQLESSKKQLAESEQQQQQLQKLYEHESRQLALLQVFVKPLESLGECSMHTHIPQMLCCELAKPGMSMQYSSLQFL